MSSSATRTNRAVYLAALVLIATGLGLILYKHFALGFPLLPNQDAEVWTIEAQVNFRAQGDPVAVSMALPGEHNGYQILNEDFASPGYGFVQRIDAGVRRADWSIRQAQGQQTLFYTLQVIANPTLIEVDTRPPQAYTGPAPVLDEAYRVAARAVLKHAHAHSADPLSLAGQLVKALLAKEPGQDARVLLNHNTRKQSRADQLVELLRMADIPARTAKGLQLEDQRRHQKLVDLLEVYDGEQWHSFDLRTGQQGIPQDMLLWQRGGVSLLDVMGGRNSEVSFSISANTSSARLLALKSARQEQVALIDFSIYSLPIAEQNAFKTILLVPIGTLIVVFLRVFIGVRTSGTFMPILMALAFIQTSLLTGLAIFIVLVSIGLWIRTSLSNLNLLLVSRISSVVIVVIMLMAGLSIISFKLGLNQILTITFFPMIILAWTIERMSVLWEEEGAREVLIQGSGSLLVATFAYLLMVWEPIKHLTFNFPELLLVILAINLLIGQYSGYRLSELVRFAPLIKQDKQP